jgi:hypothetical protein
VTHDPPLHDGGVHASGAPHCPSPVQATHPDAVQYGAPPPQAGPPLQVHSPEVHALVSPVHWVLDVQLEQPDGPHTSPWVHAGCPLHVQAPVVHVLALVPQSVGVQQSAVGMQTPAHDLCPAGQAHPVAVQVSPPVQAGAPLQVQEPDVQVLVRPVHWVLVVHEAHPDDLHTRPLLHAAVPSHVQTPFLHWLVVPVQSGSPQHAEAGMHSPLQSLSVAWQVTPPSADPSRLVPESVISLASTPASTPLSGDADDPHACTLVSAAQATIIAARFMVGLCPWGRTSKPHTLQLFVQIGSAVFPGNPSPRGRGGRVR